MALEPNAPEPPPPAAGIQRPQPNNIQSPGEESFVLFHNTTNRTITLFWCVNGNRTLHTTLKPNARCKTNTFTNHFWIFCDKDTNELMCVNRQKVFVPQLYHIPAPNNPHLRIPCRREIKIHFPMRTLRENCLWRAVSTLHTVPPPLAMDIIDKRMFIPCVLKNEIKKRLKRRGEPELMIAEIVESLLEQKRVLR